MIKECESVNHAFLEPLPYSEIKATAKSIAKYCWKNDAYCYQEFIDRQSRKGKLGNSSFGGIARSNKYIELRAQAKELKKNGKSCREIATLLNVSKSTIANWLK